MRIDPFFSRQPAPGFVADLSSPVHARAPLGFGSRKKARESEISAMGIYIKEVFPEGRELLESAYAEKFVVLSDMSSISGFSVHNDGYGNGSCTTLGVGVDETYGNYLSATIATKTHDHLVLKYPKTDLDTKLANFDTVVFYVYNGGAATGRLMANFGGSLKSNVMSLPVGEWTRVEVAKADFINGTYFGFYGVESNTQYKVSMIYGE
jgi:hypothetical protein